MTIERDTSGVREARRPRADAVRNRELLLEAAKAGFADIGAEVTLEEIARRAGVGIGTLYRHFPTRDALVEAVYRRAVEQLAEGARDLIARRPPAEALARWMDLFIDYIATKRLMAHALGALVGGVSELYAASGTTIMEAVSQLVDNAREAGAIRADVDASDVMRGLVGAAYAHTEPGWEASARRLVGILMDGLARRD